MPCPCNRLQNFQIQFVQRKLLLRRCYNCNDTLREKHDNFFYRPSAEAADIQLTTSGVESVIYNAIPDWVNEEEVFEDNKALYWSPNAERLIYGVFNDTAVEVVRLPRYGNWREDSINRQGYPFLQYFLFDDFKYPKAGTANPSVTVWCAEVGPPGPTASDRPLRQYILPPPRSLATTENHFTFVTWADNETVAVNWMNRVQNLTAINLCKVYRLTSIFFVAIALTLISGKFAIFKKRNATQFPTAKPFFCKLFFFVKSGLII